MLSLLPSSLRQYWHASLEWARLVAEGWRGWSSVLTLPIPWSDSCCQSSASLQKLLQSREAFLWWILQSPAEKLLLTSMKNKKPTRSQFSLPEHRPKILTWLEISRTTLDGKSKTFLSILTWGCLLPQAQECAHYAGGPPVSLYSRRTMWVSSQ